MRKILTIMAGVLMCMTLGAQSTSPAVLSSAGGHGESGGTSVDWTLGEMSVTTLSAASTSLTQGFHQPGLISVSTEDDLADITLSLYPNPTEDVLNLIYSGDEAYEYSLHGLSGQLLAQGQIVPGATDISLKALASGHYLLSVLRGDELIKTFKIEKTGF
jgi:hypothetical protein